MCRPEDYPPYEGEPVALLDFPYAGETVHLVTDSYVGGTLAVRAIGEDGSPWATLSVNLPQSAHLPPGHFFLKNWSENRDIAAAAEKAGVIEAANPFIHEPVHSGYVTARVYHLKGAASE